MIDKKQEGFEGQLLFRFTPDQIEQAKRDPVHRALYATDIGYYPHALNHFVSRSAGSKSNILIHCISGNGWFEIGRESYTVCEGEFFVIPAGVSHKYGSQKGWRIYWVHIEGEMAEQVLEKLAGNTYAPKIEPQRELSIDLFRNLLKRLSLRLTSDTLSYVNFSLWHLLGLYCLHETLSESKPYGHQGIQEVLIYMKEHVSDRLTLAEMAGYAQLSVSRFSKLFKEQTGHSPVDFYIRLKIHRAGQLLTSTSLKIQDIAERCGWDNPFYFSRSFHQITGYPPKVYRKIYQI